MNKRFIKLVVDILCYFGVVNYLLKLSVFFGKNELEIKLIGIIKKRKGVDSLPDVGFSRIIIAVDNHRYLVDDDLSLLTNIYRYNVIDRDTITKMASVIVSRNINSVNSLNGYEIQILTRHFCHPNYVSLNHSIFEKYRNNNDNVYSAKAYYYTYIKCYKRALSAYQSIKDDKLIIYKNVVLILALLERENEIRNTLNRLTSRQVYSIVTKVANEYCSLLRRGDISVNNCLRLIKILRQYNYLACNNLAMSICFYMKNFSSVIALSRRVFEKNKLAHTSGIEYIFSTIEVEGLEKAYLSSVSAVDCLVESKSYRTLWRLLLLLASVFEKSKVANLVDLDSRNKCFNIAKKLNQKYLYYLIFGSDQDLINSIHERFEGGRKFLADPNGSSGNFKYLSVKNINYAYIMSSCYTNYSSDDIILCEDRFLSLFESSFPGNKFISITRPCEDNALTINKWYGSDLNDQIELYHSIESQKLSYEVIEKKRKLGWLRGQGSKNYPIDKNKINIGISFGSGLTTGFRTAYNIPYSIIKLFDPKVYNIINLDFHLDSDFVEELGISQPDFDLKNDMQSLGNLISSLDILVCIPNNIMDAGAAYGKLTIVYDPFSRTSYWQYKDTDEYIFGSKVFLYRKRFDDIQERDESFVHEVCGRFNDEF